MRRESLYLEDILAATNAIAKFTAEHDVESFLANSLVRRAVVHQLMIIGEAVGRLSPTLRERHSDIPWADIRALRNIIVHNYFGTDWDQIWRTAIDEVPVLHDQIVKLLRTD